ncbi:hypothetical protein HY251_22025 [bacterium]|nr:hypothetical protein [bacterium]
MGEGARLVARTRFCVSPGSIARVPALGGTKNPDIEAIRALSPDLVLANREENRESDVLELARTLPVFVTDVRTIAQALAWREELAALLAGRAPDRSARERARPAPRRAGPRAAALVWRRPLVAVGEDTYAGDVLAAAGLSNVFPEPRYPRTTCDDLAARKPDLLVLPSEPHPWTDGEARELESELASRGSPVASVFVSGETLTWWGARTESAVAEIGSRLRAGAGKEAAP